MGRGETKGREREDEGREGRRERGRRMWRVKREVKKGLREREGREEECKGKEK